MIDRVDLFKDIIPSILQTKEKIITDENEKDYNPYIVNRALSFHMDTILYANEMNKVPNIDNKLQFDYLINTIRAYKRPFQKWQKLEKNDNLEVVKEYYNCSNEKAKEALNLLSEEQLTIMKKESEKGGIHVQSRKSSVGKSKKT